MSLSITPRQCDKPMSISSITLPPLYSDFSVTPPISPSKKIQLHQPLSPHFSCSVPSSPESMTDQSILPSTFLLKLEHQSNQPSNNGNNNAILSLHERRQRNKAASAKYRAKKNQQYGEMRSKIMSLSQENDILQRQLEYARQENHKLREACDKLRGKMLAENVLDKLLHNNNNNDNNNIHDDDLCDLINDTEEEDDEYLIVQQSQSLNYFGS